MTGLIVWILIAIWLIAWLAALYLGILIIYTKLKDRCAWRKVRYHRAEIARIKEERLGLISECERRLKERRGKDLLSNEPLTQAEIDHAIKLAEEYGLE